jgi:hypothetical protein
LQTSYIKLPLKVIGHESLGEPFTFSFDPKSQKLELQTRKKHEDNNKKELGDRGGVAKV